MPEHELNELIGMRESEVREWLAEHRHPLHRHHPNRKEAREFLERRGRFTDMDPSTDDREQVFPGPRPPIKEQTEPWARGNNGS